MPRQNIMRPYIQTVNRTVFYWWIPENKTPIILLLFETQTYKYIYHQNYYLQQY